MEYYGYNNGYGLAHYGVKGMKWGVHKAIENYSESSRRLGGNIKNRGLVKGAYQWHAQNVSKRLNNFGDKRKGVMSARQRNSYNQSKKYWDERAKGVSNRELKRQGHYRGVIKRTYDSYRSRSLGTRTALEGARQFAQTGHKREIIRTLDRVEKKRTGEGVGITPYAQLAADTVKDTAVAMIGDEFVARLFGHY